MDGPLNGLAARVAWVPPQTVPPPPLIEILRPALGDSIELVLLDAVAVAVWLHWTGRRSVPHLTGRDGCPHCTAGEPAKQYGYISAWEPRRNRLGLAEITAYALSRCPEVLQPAATRPLRGRHALLSRSPGHRSARCRIRVLDAIHSGPLPQGCDVRSTLEHLWGWDPETRALLGLDPTHGQHREESSDAD